MWLDEEQNLKGLSLVERQIASTLFSAPRIVSLVVENDIVLVESNANVQVDVGWINTRTFLKIYVESVVFSDKLNLAKILSMLISK
jgi:hypothetical protein